MLRALHNVIEYRMVPQFQLQFNRAGFIITSSSPTASLDVASLCLFCCILPPFDQCLAIVDDDTIDRWKEKMKSNLIIIDSLCTRTSNNLKSKSDSLFFSRFVCVNRHNSVWSVRALLSPPANGELGNRVNALPKPKSTFQPLPTRRC